MTLLCCQTWHTAGGLTADLPCPPTNHMLFTASLQTPPLSSSFYGEVPEKCHVFPGVEEIQIQTYRKTQAVTSELHPHLGMGDMPYPPPVYRKVDNHACEIFPMMHSTLVKSERGFFIQLSSAVSNSSDKNVHEDSVKSSGRSWTHRLRLLVGGEHKDILDLHHGSNTQDLLGTAEVP